MRLLVVTVLLATLARADDTVGVCAPSCVLGGSASQYEAGMQYQYQYQGEARSRATAGQEESRLSLTAEVVITANTPCDLKLQVANLVVEDVSDDDVKWFSEAVQKHDLHFSYQHGAVTHLCPHEEEQAVATNFKRGILSALQMTVSPKRNQGDVVVSEVDVTGQCDTKYSFVLEPSLEVTKTKTSCHASSYIPHLPHSHYTNTKGNTQFPFAKSNQTCHMQGSGTAVVRGDINAVGGGGAWQKVECSEVVEVWGPLKPGSDPLAFVTLSSVLSLEEGPSPMNGNFSKGDEVKRKVSLMADLKAAVEFAEVKKLQGSGVKDQVDSVLESLSASESPEGEELRPRLFSSFIHLLGHLEEEELEALWGASSTQKAKRKVLLDGLLVCDATPCHVMVAQLASEQGQLTPGQMNMWLAGLHLHTSAHPSLVTQLLDLAESKRVASAAVMAASSVVHRLCQQQPEECAPVAQPFLEFVDQEVGESCGLGKTKLQQEHIKLILRATGNAGVMPSHHFPEKCYMNRALPPELRIVALQSYRRTDCTTNTEVPWKLLEDGSEKSEVRIAAYLALVPCAAHSPGFFTRIHKLLQREEIQQVYAFIWTHVKNLAEQPGPSKHDQTLSKLARQHSLPNKFNNDAFRSSGHYRYAEFDELLNLGGRVDASVVYSQDSYLPQHVSANLTLDLLDNSFNFLDFGGEFSGIENIIEGYFGKEGYFGNEDILKVLQSLRPKRNIIHDDKIQEFQKMYDEAKDRKKLGAETDEMDEMEEKEAKTSFYVRMFGNEVFYVENVLQYSPAQLLYHLIKEISSPKIFKIIDQEYMAPTFLGFPLRLKLNATASVSIKHQHTFHNTHESGLLLEGSLAPTVVAAMDETLMVDAFVSSSGLRRSSTQMAKINIGGKFSYDDGEVTELQVSVPDEEVAKVSSSVTLALLKGAGRWEELEGASTMKENHCTGTFEEEVGLKTCTSLSHNSYEVDGQQVTIEPYKSEFKVTRTDTFKYYKLYIKQQDNIVEALFDTPGSSIDRKIHFLFNMSPNRESGYIIVRGVGYGIKGQYKNTQGEQELQLQYLQASEVLGELEVSLQKQKEGSGVEYMPNFLLAMGPNKFTLEGKLKHGTDEDTKESEASWEIEGGWHKKESAEVMQAFGSASGNFLVGPEETKLNLSTEYGSDPSQPHSITLSLGSTHTLSRNMKTTKGHASLQISQVPAGLTLEYEGQPDLFDLSINTSLHDTQVSSEVVLKDVTQGDGQDSQLTLSLASPQLNLDYKASGIYKVSESGVQAEVELNLGTSLKSKILFTYLSEDDPLHILTGLHLTLDDFVFQVGYSVDMSQPDHFLITASGTVGEGMAGLSLKADYGCEYPFNASFEVYAGLGTYSVGLASHTSSDTHWHNFTGKSTVKWLDWSASLAHEVVFNETTKGIKLSLEDGGSVEFFSKTWPDQTVKVVVRDTPGDSSPVFTLGAERHVSSEKCVVQVNLTSGDSQLMHLVWNIDSKNEFSFGLHLLESQLDVEGLYNVMDNGTVSGASQAKVMLPSGDSVSANLSLSYVTMENERLLMISGSHEGSVIESQLVVSLGGTRDTETAGINFTLTTPHPHLQKFGFDFHRSGGANSLHSVEIELDEFKILGEAQLSDPSDLLFKLEYDGGEECASRFHLQHSHSEQKYFSLASLALTQASEPWELILNTSLDHSSHRQFLDTELGIQAPVMPNPFRFHGLYNMTENEVHFEMETDLGESISVLYQGKKEFSWKRHLLHGLGKVEASWMEPIAINVTYDHTLGGINVNIDFQNAGDYISSWSTEFSSEYSSLEDIKASFYLTHPELQITMQLVHNQSQNSWKQQLDGSINTFTITYNTNMRWNEYLVPTKAEGSLSLFNFFDHSLDLSLSHLEESSTHKTQVTGTFDDYNIGLEHQLSPKLADGGWQDSLQVILRDIGATTGGVSLTTNTFVNWPTINSSLTFESPWTDSFSATFLVQEMNMTTSFKLDAFHSDESLLSGHVMFDGWPSYDRSDIELEVAAVFMEDLNLKLQHDFNSGNLIFGDMFYGSDVHMQLGSHLKMKETWYDQEFVSYVFNVSSIFKQLNIDFRSMAAIDYHLNATLEGHWNENSLSVNSSVQSGKILEVEFMNPNTNYISELTYELGNDVLFTLNFALLRDGENLVLFKTVVESVHPKLDATLTLKLFADTDSESHGTILVTADLSKLKKYSLQGRLELESNLFASKEYGGKLDLDLSFLSDLSWKGVAGIAVHGGEWDIRSGLNSSLELSRGLSFEFGTGFHLLHGNETFDLKDVNVVVSAKSGAAYEMRVILQPNHTGPPWSLAVIYNPRFRTLKGFLSLADHGKYELSLRLSTKTLTMDAHRVNEDDSKWQIVEGNINWIIKKTKQLVTLNMKSDIPAISKITGKIIVQQKRDLAVIATLKVNDDQFHGNFRLSTPERGKSFRLDVKVDNSIVQVFESEVTVECSFDESGLSYNMKIGLNQVTDWIKANVKFSVPESYLKLKTPFSFLESFNATITTKASEEYIINTVIEAPQFCWNLTANLGRLVLHGSLNINLDLPCGGDSLFNFYAQYNIGKNPIGVSCELSVMEYGSLFKFNTTGNLSLKGVDLRIETEAYPQHTFGLELVCQVVEKYNLKLLAYDPPSNKTYFSFETLLSPSKAELAFMLSEEQSLLLKANYDFENQPLRLNSSLSSSFFYPELTAKLAGKATVGMEEGNIEMSFSSNTVFSYFNVSTTYSFLEELKDISFKILTPKGDTDGEIRVLKDKDFYSIKADMSSGLHTFDKYHLEVRQTTEDNVDKLVAMLVQGDIEYQFSGLRNITEKGTEVNTNVSLPFEGYEHFNFYFIHPNDFSTDKYLTRLTLKSQNEIHIMEAKHDPDISQYQLVINQTNLVGEYVFTLRYNDYSSSHQIEAVLNGPELEGNPLTLLLKYDPDGLVSAVFYSPHGQLGAESSWTETSNKIILSGTAHLTLFGLGEYHLDMNIPLVVSDELEMKMLCVYPEVAVEMWLHSSEYFRTGGIGLIVKKGEQSKDYSLVYDFKHSLVLKGQFDQWNLNTTLVLKGTHHAASSGTIEVRSNLPGYEAIDGTWEVGQRNWEYFGQASLEVKHQEVLSLSTTLNTLSEGAYQPWQNVRLTMLLESPFTLPHHLHAEYQTSTPKLLLYYQHGLDTFKMQLIAFFGRNTATLALTGNIPVRGVSTFDINVAYNFVNSYSASVVVKVEDSTLEHKFDFSPDWRVGSVQMALTSPFLRPGKAQFSWSLVQNSAKLKGFFSMGEHSGKMKISLKNTRSSADFDCHITTAMEKLSQFIVNLSYKMSSSNNFDASIAARLNNHGVLMKSSLDTKGGKLLLKFQGTFEILGNRGSLDVDVGPSGDGYSGSAMGQLPGYKKFSADLYFDSFQLNLKLWYDSQELVKVSITYSKTVVHFYWTDYWSFTLTTEHVSKGRKHLLTVMFTGFDVDPIKLEASYSQRRNHQVDLSLTSSLLPLSTLQIAYSGNKVTVRATMGDKTYLMTGRANFGNLQSSFDVRFESSDRPDDPIVMQAEYDLTDFFRGRMKAAMELAQITLDWGEKIQVNVTGQRSGDMAKIDLKVGTPLKSFPHLHTGFHGEFFLKGLIGFNCTAFVEWSERVEVAAIAKLTQADVNVECILMTSFPSLEKLSTSFRLEPGQLQLTAQHNDDMWKAVWEYQFTPFSITCLLETPLENLEKISLSLSVNAGDEQVGAQFELSWPKGQRLGIDIEAKRWQVEVNFRTPWEPFTAGTFTASLKTEGEELTLSSVLQLDNHEAEVSFVLLSTNFKFSATYRESLITVGLTKLEYSQRDNSMRISLQVQTPYESLKFLESSLKFEGNKLSLIFTINEIVNAVEGVFTINGGELTADIPLLNNFSWSLKSENSLQAETSVTFDIAGMSEPLMASFSYNIEPQTNAFKSTFRVVLDEELMSVDVKFDEGLSFMVQLMEYILDLHVGASGERTDVTIKLEAPDLGLKSGKIESAFEVQKDPFHLDFVLSVLVEQFGKEALLYKMQGTFAVEDDQILLTSKIESNKMPTYQVIIRSPFDTLGLQIMIRGDDTELFSLQYSFGSQRDLLLPQKLVVRAHAWKVEGQLLLTHTSLTASLILPQPSGEHSLTILWPEQLNLQELEISAELRSSYIPQDVLQLAIIYKRPEDFKGKIELNLVFGDKDMRANGDYHYDEELKAFTAKFQLTSNWVGDFSLQTSAQWRRNIVASASLQAQGEKHSFSLYIDTTNSAIELKLNSPWLPAREITFTGEMSSPLNLSRMTLISRLQADDEEVQLEARFESDQTKHANSYVVLRRNNWDVFSLSLEMYEDVTRTDFDLSINLLLEDLKNSIHVRYYNAEWGRYFSGTLNSHMLTETVQLTVINSHIPSSLQSIELSGPDFRFFIECHVSDDTFTMNIRLGFDEIDLFVSSDIFEGSRLGVRLVTTFISCESLLLQAMWGEPDRKEIKGEYSGNGEVIKFSGEILVDDIFGYSINAILVTSFEGYERFALFTPQHKSGKHSKALLEYPGRKVGAEINLNYQHITDSDFTISLYLPYDNFEIISVKYIMDNSNHFEIEARTGKIGLTVSSVLEPLVSGMLLESIVAVNEYREKSVFYYSRALNKRVRARYSSVFEPRGSMEQHSFHGEVFCDISNRIFLTARDNEQEWITVHVAWGADKILTLSTPKFLPHYVHVNFECSSSRDDYRFEYGLLTADGRAWSVYGLQLHQETLAGGRYLALMGHSGEYLVSVEGTLSVNSCHFNNSLVFSLNKNKLGYKALLLSESGILSRMFTSDIQLLLHNRTLLYHTDATASPKSLDLISNFTWNKIDMDMPPITFKLNYDDDTFFFVSGTKYLNAVLSHPDIKDIRLQANVTRTLNSSLYGSAELVDDNSPELKVVATLDAEPARQDGKQTVSLSLSQPVSNLSVLVEAQLWQSYPLSEALCLLKYYSLTSEDWHQLNLSASLVAEGGSHAVTVFAGAPERGWDRTWRGVVDSHPEEASIHVEGSSDGPGDAWRLGAVVRKRLPELRMFMSVGREQEVHQEARVRLGLHSPVEAGAALDHFSFGQWHQDTAAVGLRLTSPHVLQAFMEVDPSLNYEDPYEWARLFSPAAEVVDIWGRDVVKATQNLKHWAATEAPVALETLFHNETIEAVWQREASNLDYFLKDVEDSYLGIAGDVTTLWESVLLPVIDAVKDFNLRIQAETLSYLANLKSALQYLLEETGQWLRDAWHSLETESALGEAVVREWLSEGLVSLGQSASTFWTDLLHWATWFGEQMSTSVTTFLEESKSYFIMLGQTIEDFLSSGLHAIRPYFEGLSQTFQSYGNEVLAEFSGPCWMALTDKGNNLAAIAQGVDGGMRVVTEFLQAEKFSAFFVEAGNWLQEKMSVVWSSIEATMTEAGQSLPQVLSSWSPPLSESFSQAWDTLTGLANQVSVEGLYPLVVSMTGGLQEKVTQLPMVLRETIEPLHVYLIQFSAIESLNEAVRGVYQWGESAWQSWSSGKRTGLSFPEQTVFLLADAVQDYLPSTDCLLNYIFVVEPSMLGHVHYNQYLPAYWNSFLELPQWNFPFHLFQTGSAASEAKRLMAAASPSPSLVKALLPFHTATAVIAGQHVTTFDLRHYQFLGSCSYLLAKDFEGGDFEVFGEYESEAGATRLKSLVVHGPNIDVTLSVDGSVTSRGGSDAEIHNSTEYSALKMPDLFLSCHRALRGCSLTVSGKYFGRLGGLLGNYNGEASDDLRGPGDQVVEDAAQLATQWAISPTPCYQANQAHMVEDYNGVEEAGVRECSHLFLYSNSPLSECFQAVDPHPYFTHCIDGHTHPAFSEQDLNSPCTAVSAYRTQCWARKRHLPNLDRCQNVSTTGCTVAGKEVPYGWSQVYEETSHGSADVAIIVELAECNAGREMTSLLDHLARQFGRKNINDVRYAVVAAGEDETITKSFLSKTEAETFLSSLTFSKSTNVENTEAVVTATATGIEWRPGVSRSVVHIGCQVCERGDAATKALHQNDVTYHLVSSLEVEMSGTKGTAQARIRKLFGFDENLVYVPGDFKTFRGSEKLRLALRSPKGGCVAAALSTGGSVFDSEKWTPRRAIQTRKFLSVLGERVAVSSSPPKCQECHCLKGDTRMVPTCFKCFGNSVFLVTHVDTVAEDVVMDTTSITQDIKRSFQEVFLERNNSTMLRIL